MPFVMEPQIVLGSIVTRCPSMSLAPSALVQLDSACELFSKAARGFRAQPVLVSPHPVLHVCFSCSRKLSGYHAHATKESTHQPE